MSNVLIGNNVLIGSNNSIGDSLFTGKDYGHYKILVVSESKYFFGVCNGDFDDIFLDALSTQGINLGGTELADCAAFMNYDAYQPPQLSQAIAALTPGLILALLKEESKQVALNATGFNVYDATPHVRAPFRTVFHAVMNGIVNHWNGRVRFEADKRRLRLNSNKNYPINLFFLEDYINYIKRFDLWVDTVVGVKGKRTNERLYKKLYRPANIVAVQKNYDGCFFMRGIKIKTTEFNFAVPFYFHSYIGAVPNDAGRGVDGTLSLKDYIGMFFGNKPLRLIRDGLSKQDCIKELFALGNTNDLTSALRYDKYSWFYWSEYLDICSPPVDIIALASRNNAAAVNAFKDEINRHVEGMILIDRIY